MTNLDNELYTVLDDDLCNLAGRLVQNDTEVVLCGVSVVCTSLGSKCTLERTLWVGSEALGSLNTWNTPEYGKVPRSIRTYLPLISGRDDSGRALTNSRGDLREDRLNVTGEHHSSLEQPATRTVTYGAMTVYTTCGGFE